MSESKTNCIIVHGCPDNSSEEKTKEYAGHWMPWIKKQLEQRGVETHIPLMPEPWQMNYTKFKHVFEKETITENTILIGHSCGCAFLVRWLGESKQKIKKLVLVAPWKIAPKGDIYRENFYNYEIDETIKERIPKILMFTSDNEEIDGKKSLGIYHNALGGKVIELSNKGHFILPQMKTEEFPELLNELI